MKQHFSVFLRGVNVNGTRMHMDELKRAFETMGYKKIKTLLASGNVVVTSEDEGMTLLDHKMKIEMGLSLHFAYEAYVIVKDEEQLIQIVEEASHHLVPEGYHHYLFLTNDDTLPGELANLHHNCKKEPNEQLIVEPSGTYWIVPKGMTLQSAFGDQVLGKSAFKSRLTSRTMNTVIKVMKALSEREN